MICLSCKYEKPMEAFRTKSKTCNDCLDIKKGRKYTSQQVYVYFFLALHPCVKCGISNPVVLEFHHINGEKEDKITTFVKKRRSIKDIKAEMMKCEVLCANCHREETARIGSFYRYRMFSECHQPKQSLM